MKENFNEIIYENTYYPIILYLISKRCNTNKISEELQMTYKAVNDNLHKLQKRKIIKINKSQNKNKIEFSSYYRKEIIQCINNFDFWYNRLADILRDKNGDNLFFEILNFVSKNKKVFRENLEKKFYKLDFLEIKKLENYGENEIDISPIERFNLPFKLTKKEKYDSYILLFGLLISLNIVEDRNGIIKLTKIGNNVLKCKRIFDDSLIIKQPITNLEKIPKTKNLNKIHKINISNKKFYIEGNYEDLNLLK